MGDQKLMGAIAKGGPTPFEFKKPTGPRNEFVRDLVDRLLDALDKFVLRLDHAPDKVRECYEMSWDLRQHLFDFERVVRYSVPGSFVGWNEGKMYLARRIAMMFVNRIDNELIRPGPRPEDRCTSDMASEACLLRPELIDLVASIIEVDDRERKLIS
jgi:hypothetical protein